MFQNPRKSAFRRGWPISGYVGPNGAGKTAAMVWDTKPTLDAGRPVLSTVRLLDYGNPRLCDDDECGHPDHEVGMVQHQAAHPLWIPFTTWDQLLNAKDMDVLMDEVTGVASSRESQAMPAVVANKLVQMRRDDVIIRWTAPRWARADKIIRECSQAVTHCRGYLPKAVLGDGGEQKAWRTRRLFKWKTYDADDFEDFTVGKRESMNPMQSDWHYGPRSPVFAMYDTFDAVTSIGTVSDSGRCYRCGGSRPVPKCSCTGPVKRGPKPRDESPEVGPPQGVPRHSHHVGDGHEHDPG